MPGKEIVDLRHRRETSCKDPLLQGECLSHHSFVANPEGVPVSVRSSSEWEAVTTPDATFFGVALVARAARDGVEVFGGTYSGSCSSLEPLTSRADGAIDFELPHA